MMQREMMRVVKIPGPTSIRVARGDSFLLEYSTSAIASVKLFFSAGLSPKDTEEPHMKNTKPGGYTTHRKLVFVSEDAPEYGTISEVIISPTFKVNAVNTIIVQTYDEDPNVLALESQLPVGKKWKMEPAASDKPIIYLSTGFIDGTRINMQFKMIDREQQTYLYKNLLTNRTAVVEDEDVNTLRRLINGYVLNGAMHEHTEDDDPRCCDIGTTRILFDNYAAEPNRVKELVELFEKYKRLSK